MIRTVGILLAEERERQEVDVSEITSGNSLGFLLADVSRLLRQFFERQVAANGFGLTPGEIRALGYAIRFRGSRQAVLAEHMGVEPMTLSAYLDRLEVRSLVERSTDPTDRRAKIVEPTPAAFSIIAELDPLFNDIYVYALNGIAERDVESMAASLRAMRANLTTDPALLAPTDLTGGNSNAQNARKRQGAA